MVARDSLTTAAGVGVFIMGAAAARHPGVSGLEHRAFRAVNELPAGAHTPVWVLMQLGSLGGAVGVGAVTAVVTGNRRLGARLALAGTLTWAAAKALKASVGRGRPAAALEVTRVLGRPASGLGYPSGHAAVAASLAAVSSGQLTPPWPAMAWTVALLVGPTRLYVGAHLPLDVIGGAGLGVAIGSLVRSRGLRGTV